MNSFIYAAACIAIILGLSIAYIVSRRLLPYAEVLSFLAMAPFIIPDIVLAIAFYAAYAPPPFALYRTVTILILAFATRFPPTGYVNADAAIRSINPEMEEAVRILGGGACSPSAW
jgi:iron(III) transport system permease protein